MARRRKSGKNIGMGMVMISAMLIFLALFLFLIPALPFQMTNNEQTVVYVIGFLVMMAGLIVLVYDLVG